MFFIKGDLIFVSANTDIVGDLVPPPHLFLSGVSLARAASREKKTGRNREGLAVIISH